MMSLWKYCCLTHGLYGYRVKDIGNTVSGRKGENDSMTLQSQRFQIGDYLDIAITPPNRAPPLNPRMGMGRPF
uniref:18 kDa Sin3-associated polypeptide n=1 Tax=Hucho hucho TaxID=62062 RepID=A0A4W5LPI9_9TELE